jgi:DNA-binding NarL/FixJ family response regulator
MTSVMLVDDHALIRDGLRRAFDRVDDLDVVGEASSVAQALRLFATLHPDVVVIDVGLPDGNGHDLVKELRTQRDDVGLVVLTFNPGDEQLFKSLDAGASGFVTKAAPAEDVVAAARHAAASPQSFTAADLASAIKRKNARPPGPQLSGRELEVLTLLVDGLTISAISKRLYISDSTTKTHVAKIYSKLEVSNRAQAVRKAINLKLVEQATPA